MSTFNGVIAEFPEIRIDYFRQVPYKTPPLACFLSHVHSDHLQGLESLKSPFIYCSQATRELLLRLEKFPHRMNFARGNLETRKIHYKHLKNLLRPIPLCVPTEIELTPDRVIRVTLFDANHCTGAVMFLVEDASNAVLYTGDIRAELWWVNAIARDPVLVPYTSGLRRLDKIYLDTTFATKSDFYAHFPTKAEGLQELLTKITAYPNDTVFHFNAWTFGYEGVWLALASALKSQVHVDQYKWGLYSALASCPNITPQDGSALCGYKCGNRSQPGCLTLDVSVRLHSCERGVQCDPLKSPEVVWIVPIITRATNGGELPEIGAGGGGGDLEQSHALDLQDTTTVHELIELCSKEIADKSLREATLGLISEAVISGSRFVAFKKHDLNDNLENMPLKELAKLLQKTATSRSQNFAAREYTANPTTANAQGSMSHLPTYITFPYSRHSSYEELCRLVGTFKPVDVYPCTVDSVTWNRRVSMEVLFGNFCSGNLFAHDKEMITLKEERASGRGQGRGDVRRHISQSSYTMDDGQAELAAFIDVSPGLNLSRSRDSDRKVTLMPGGKGVDYVDTTLDRRREAAIQATESPGEKRARHIKAAFDTKAPRDVSLQSRMRREKAAAEIDSASKRMRSFGHKRIESSLEPSTSLSQAIEVSNSSTHSHPQDLVSLDIPLGVITDTETRALTSKIGRLLHCSNVMACILAETAGDHLLHDLCRAALAIADNCSRNAYLVSSLDDGELATKIIYLRDLLPIADEHSCQSALMKSKGKLQNARDIVVQDQGRRLSELARAGFPRDTADGSFSLESDHAEPQPSLPESTFGSQRSIRHRARTTSAEITRRKEAYAAAVGKDGQDWSSCNLMSSSSVESMDDVELG